MDERATLADRMYTVGRESGDRPCGCGGTCGESMWGFERGDLAAVSRELEPLALRGRVAHPGGPLARAAGAGRPRPAGPIRRLPAAGRPRRGRAPAVGGRAESAQVNRSALLSLVGLHTGEASDLTGLLDYGPGHEDGDGLDFPVEGVIFSIAAAFFLAHGGQLAQAATVYRRLGPLRAGGRPPRTTSCFASGRPSR